MANIEAYSIWRLKPGIEISKKDLTFFSPGGYEFTHKSGKTISFDFEDSYGGYNIEDRLLDFSQENLEHDFLTEMLKENKFNDLIQEEYDLEFFKDGKINLENDCNEMYCCMDINLEEVDHTLYVEPVYMSVFDTANENESVELLNKLTELEYAKYINRKEGL